MSKGPILVHPWNGQYAETNSDRAAMTRPFVTAYAASYYGLDADAEDYEMVISDLIANLLHLADELCSDDDGLGSDLVLSRAQGHYEAEVEEAKEDDDAGE